MKNNEEEFFAKQEIEKKRAFAQKLKDQMALKEQEALKALHHMHCPKCGMTLQEVKFRGIHIDKCFSCGGTFLDQGELEEIAGQENNFVDSLLQIFKA